MLDFSSAILIVALLYVYWVGPVLIFLNWLLTRCLARGHSGVSIAMANVVVSLLLLGPIKSPGDGFLFRDSYGPWYFGGSSDLLSCIGLVGMCLVSVVTTLVSFSNQQKQSEDTNTTAKT